MSFPRLSPARSSCSRKFHTARTLQTSPFFQLSALSNSRETAWASRTSSLSRIEHSPALALIRSSEVEPFAKSKTAARTVKRRRTERVDESIALALGRDVLRARKEEVQRLRRCLGGLKKAVEREKIGWLIDRRKLERDVRSAAGLVVLAVGVATATATWRFWPESGLARQPRTLKRFEMPKGATSAVVAADGIQDIVVATDRDVAKLDVQPIRSTHSWSSWFWSEP